MKRQINMCTFMPMIYIEIKLGIDINNDGLLIMWEHNKKENNHWYYVAMVAQDVEYKWVESNSITSQ